MLYDKQSHSKITRSLLLVTTVLWIGIIIHSCSAGNPGYNHAELGDKNDRISNLEDTIRQILYTNPVNLIPLNISDIPVDNFNYRTYDPYQFKPAPNVKYFCGYELTDGKFRRKWFVSKTQWKIQNIYITRLDQVNDTTNYLSIFRLTVEAPNEDYKIWRHTEPLDDDKYSFLIQRLSKL
jgi:hypothetical protein